MNLPLVYCLGQKHMSSEAETMRTYLVGVLLGVIPSLALGVWLGASPSLPFSEWRENAQEEAFYQGRPTSFWLLRLEDHDSMYRLEAVQALRAPWRYLRRPGRDLFERQKKQSPCP